MSRLIPGEAPDFSDRRFPGAAAETAWDSRIPPQAPSPSGRLPDNIPFQSPVVLRFAGVSDFSARRKTGNSLIIMQLR